MKWLPSILKLAQSQHGVIALFQLEQLGIPRSSQNSIVKSRVFERRGFGIYCLIGAEQTWRHKASLAILSCGPTAYLSHESVLINMELLAEHDRRSRYGSRHGIHVISSRRLTKKHSIINHCSQSFDSEYTTCIFNGIPQVTLDLAIIDSAARLADSQLASVVDSAIRRHLIQPGNLLLTLENLSKSSSRETRRLIGLLNDHVAGGKEFAKAESVLELRVQRVLRNHLNITVVPQYEIHTDRKTYRIDLAIVEKQIAIEIDGFIFHRNRNNYDSDRYRQNDLVAAGWKMVRITSAFSDAQIIRSVQLILLA